MKIQNAKTIGDIENQADSKGRGSVFRACLAIQRSGTDEIGSKVFELGYSYVAGMDTLKQLKAVVTETLPKANLLGSSEFEQALQALKNALEDAPSIKKGQKSKVDERQDLWLRLERLVNAR